MKRMKFFRMERRQRTGKSDFAGLADQFPVFQYHNRWKILKPEDFTGKVKYTFDNFWKGFRYTDRVDPYLGKRYMRKRKKKTKIDGIPRFYLDKIVSMCKEKGIKLLFVEIPSANSWNYKRHNSVAEYAEQNEIPFLDLNKPGKEYKVDWVSDTRDKGDHMNYNGARKVTAYLGKYLKENYFCRTGGMTLPIQDGMQICVSMKRRYRA